MHARTARSIVQVKSRATVVACGFLLMTAATHAASEHGVPWVFDLPKGGSNCSELSPVAVPIRYDVSFEGDIRQHLQVPCGGCHINGGVSGFNMSITNVRTNLIGAGETGAPFTNVPTIVRVRPGRPLESGLFLKVNCGTPQVPYGAQMPIGGSPLTPEVQALIHDWIAAGALMPDSPGGDRTFIGNFESIVRPAP